MHFDDIVCLGNKIIIANFYFNIKGELTAFYCMCSSVKLFHQGGWIMASLRTLANLGNIQPSGPHARSKTHIHA